MADEDEDYEVNDFEEEDDNIIEDESGFAQNMPRTHGYSYRGKRCYGVQDWHAKGRIDVISAMVRFVFLTIGLLKTILTAMYFMHG